MCEITDINVRNYGQCVIKQLATFNKCAILLECTKEQWTARMPIEKPAHSAQQKERTVWMSNALVRAAQGLNLAEKRITALAIAEIDRRATSLPVTTLRALDYAKQYEVDEHTAYDALARAGKSLMRKQIRHIESNGTEELNQWVLRSKYKKHEGVVEIEWSPFVVPHLIQLKQNFTTYKLKQASALRSIHAWRMLELISQYKDTGKLAISLEDFAAAMEASAAQRANFAHMRRQIIEPALKELAEKDDLVVALERIKTGKKVTGLRFTFEKAKQQRLPLEHPRQPRARARGGDLPAPGPRLRRLADYKDRPLSALPPVLIASEIGPKAQRGETWDQAWERIRRSL